MTKTIFASVALCALGGAFSAGWGTVVSANQNNSNTGNTNASMPNENMGTNHDAHHGNMNHDMGTNGAALSGGDRSFATTAAQGGMAEVEFARIVVGKTANEEVRGFAQRMIDDHSKANQQLMSLASGIGLTLPADLDAKHRKFADRLNAASGAELDRLYMDNMVKDHKTDVALFEKESTGGRNDTLKGFASSTLPTLQDHLRMAQDVDAHVRGAANTNSDMHHHDANANANTKP